MRTITSILFHVLAGMCICQGQVRVDKPIELTGSEPDQRQVHGVPNSNSPDALLNSESELSAAHRYAEPAAGGIWQVDLPALDQPPIAGTQILVKAPQPTEGPIGIMVNEYGPFSITVGASGVVQGNSIPEGTMLSLVYDGVGFQLMNGSAGSVRPCPEGMVAVNDQFCIGTTGSTELVEFWVAIENCGAMGQRLCTWGEFYAACSNAGILGITDMTNGWEWTNQTANEDAGVRIVGTTNCYNASVASPTANPYSFRCCFTR